MVRATKATPGDQVIPIVLAVPTIVTATVIGTAETTETAALTTAGGHLMTAGDRLMTGTVVDLRITATDHPTLDEAPLLRESTDEDLRQMTAGETTATVPEGLQGSTRRAAPPVTMTDVDLLMIAVLLLMIADPLRMMRDVRASRILKMMRDVRASKRDLLMSRKLGWGTQCVCLSNCYTIAQVHAEQSHLLK
jgi:hypothetical protein